MKLNRAQSIALGGVLALTALVAGVKGCRSTPTLESAVNPTHITTNAPVNYTSAHAVKDVLLEKNPQTNTTRLAGVLYTNNNQKFLYETNWTQGNRTNELNFVARSGDEMQLHKNPVTGVAQNMADVYVFELLTNQRGAPVYGINLATNGPDGISVSHKFKTATTNTPLQAIVGVESAFNRELYNPNILSNAFVTPLVEPAKRADTAIHPRYHVPATNSYVENANGSLTLRGPIYQGKRMSFKDYVSRTNTVSAQTNVVEGTSGAANTLVEEEPAY